MKILFLVPYPTEGPSNRVRVEQYIPSLGSHGIDCVVRPFMSSYFFKILYERGRYIEKAFWFIICTLNRFCDIWRAWKSDVVFIHREAYPVGGAFFEKAIDRMGKTIIFDFDDAIFLPNTSKENSYIERFKRPGKVAEIIRISRQVIVGNNYLKEYAIKYNQHVTVIPSSVDTDTYVPGPRRSSGKQITIGWIGSNTTKRFLQDIENVLVEVSAANKYIQIKVVGPDFTSVKLHNLVNKRWALADEVADIQSFDIGIMPMPDDEWTRGKCAFKVLLCMACGVPTVSSRVGMNAEVIDEGLDGFLAGSDSEWLEKLSLLVEDRELRSKIGSSGRTKVIEKYSAKISAPIFYDVIKKAVNR